MKYILTILTLLILLSSCNNEKQTTVNSQENTKKEIFTSFYPIYFLTKSFVWDNVSVTNIVPNSGESHWYEPSLKQVWDMKKADLIVLSWLWMESYEEKLVQSVWTWKVIMVSEEIVKPLKMEKKPNVAESHKKHWHNHWDIDPHTWISVKTYLDMAKNLANKLEKAWFVNLDKSIITKLEALDKKYSETLANCSQKQFVTSHRAFWYLARDYNFNQVAIFWISPHEEPSAKVIADTVELVKKYKLPYIFAERKVSPKFADTIKKETWANILIINAIETLIDEEQKAGEDYISLMEKNLENLKIWLNCK